MAIKYFVYFVISVLAYQVSGSLAGPTAEVIINSTTNKNIPTVTTVYTNSSSSLKPTTVSPIPKSTPTTISPNTTSTPANTTSTPANTTSTPANTTSTPADTTSTPVTTTSTPVTTTSTPVTTTSTPSTTINTSNITTAVTTSAPVTTAAPSHAGRHFDGPSFIGGIILASGLMGIAFVSWKFYKARTERNYHTL